MSPRTGRPTANKKTERLEIRLTPQEAEKLQYCADKMSVSKTDVINRGIDLVQAELDKNKTTVAPTTVSTVVHTKKFPSVNIIMQNEASFKN